MGGLIAVALFTVGGVWTSMMYGYQLVSGPDPALAQTPLQQTVERAPGAWLTNFHSHRVLWLIPTVAYQAFLSVCGRCARVGRTSAGGWERSAGSAFSAQSVRRCSRSCCRRAPSLRTALRSGTASSSRYTLGGMLGFTVVFMPLIIWYTSWAFWVMRGKVSTQHVESDEHAY